MLDKNNSQQDVARHFSENQEIAELQMKLGMMKAAVDNILSSPVLRGAQHKAMDERVTNLEMAIDCLISDRQYVAHDDIAFNGQVFRKKIFLELMQAFVFQQILETGTWTGNTTAYMRQNSGVPVCSVEVNERFHAIAKMRLEGIEGTEGIQLVQGESSEFLNVLSRSDAPKANTFIYLDAHWYNDLPLERELDIIAKHWPNVIIMVDDFEVPGDTDYGYDAYPNGQKLDFASYAEVFARHDLVAFFPSSTSAEETGAKRGCVVLGRLGEAADILASMSTLKRHQA